MSEANPIADDATAQPDGTAVRVALWRAMHVEIDPPPHVLEDVVGLQLAAPPAGWRSRGDMNPQATRRNRASVVARARYIEDLVEERARRGVDQYVIPGAGLDTFAQRKPEIASQLRIFEIDQPDAQAWKRRRLIELGFGTPDWLRFVPANFEADGAWRTGLTNAGFDHSRSAVVASTGLSMYLSGEANAALLREIATLAGAVALAMTFMPPLALVDADERGARQAIERGTRAAGSPFISFFAPADVMNLASGAGFAGFEHVSAASLAERYFAGRTDGLRPSSSEELLVAST